MSGATLLVIDDDDDIRRLLSLDLGSRGYRVHEAADATTGMQQVKSCEPEILLVDLNLPDGSGLDVVRQVRDEGGDTTCVIVISGEGTVQSAVTALKEGADNFVTKPLDLDVLSAIIRKAEEGLVYRRQLLFDKRKGSALARLQATRSPSVKKVLEALPALAESDGTVLITGESGTGKSLLARALHELGPRRSRPFVELNCSSLTRELLESELFGHAAGAFTGASQAKPGLIEIADTGSFFLDEIGDMDVEVQPKILKVIEDQEIRRVGSVQAHSVNVRVVAATHCNLEEYIEKGLFRADLYYRLNVLSLELPPLRERREDVLDLAQSFLALRGRQARGFAPDAERWMEDYDWPGNIRELRNLVERAAVYAGTGRIRPEHFGVDTRARPVEQDAPHESSRSASLAEADWASGRSLEEVERHHVARVLSDTGGNRSQAARILGITRQTLLRKIRAHGLEQQEEGS